mgnify:FL=1
MNKTFTDIFDDYIIAIEEAGTNATLKKENAKLHLYNLADILDGRYSPDISPSTTIEQWESVNKGKAQMYVRVSI